MSPHHSDQMSQRSQVSRAALCMSKSKVAQSVSQSVSDKVTYWAVRLSSGQLKIKGNSVFAWICALLRKIFLKYFSRIFLKYFLTVIFAYAWICALLRGEYSPILCGSIIDTTLFFSASDLFSSPASLCRKYTMHKYPCK